MAAELFMVFDVESVGLHGEGFAVGWVVVDREGRELEWAMISVPPDYCRGSKAGREWVAANVPELESARDSAADMRQVFWKYWLEWKAKGAVLVTDCGWPVEARFLAACVDDRPEDREWEGPYPLHELVSLQLAAGMDPLAKRDRRPNELPEHDPLADARQSARLLVETLRVLDGVCR